MLKELLRSTSRRFGIELTRTATHRGVSLIADLQRLFTDARIPLFDVGANVGRFATMLAKEFPDRMVYACEPAPPTIQQLRRNTTSFPNVRIIEAAFGEHCGTASFTMLDESTWNHITTDVEDGRTTSVPLLTIDSICEREKIDEIGLLKTDCEGYDLAVLHGAEQMFSRCAIQAVYCEVNFRRDGRQGDFFAIHDYLSNAGYHFYALYDYSGPQGPITESFENALWVSPRISGPK